jgi:hypothetical protein
MSKDLESQMRAALRPVAPSDAFSQKLIAKLAAQHRAAHHSRWQAAKPAAWWASLAMAACLLIAIGIQHRLQESRERESGLAARREVVEALRVTSQKLNLAYEVVKGQSSS